MSFSPPTGTPLKIYQYESVDLSASYLGTRTYTYTVAGSTTTVSNLVTSLSPYVRLTNSNYIGGASTTTTDLLAVNATDPSGNVFKASYPFSIGLGRFLPLSYNANVSNGSNIVLYVNEAFSPIRFQTQQLAINTPSTYVNNVPTSLPVGLSLVKVGSNAYDLSGTPAAQAVSRNYYFLSTGVSNSFTVSTYASIIVNPERVVLSPPGPTLSFSGLAVGSNIGSTPITATYPSNAIGNLLYTWTTLPAGFSFVDPFGAVITGNRMYSRDAASTITLTGKATVDTLNFFVANGNPFTTTLTATRQTQPLISNTLGFQFSFQPSVIFTPPVVKTQYVGVPFIPSGQPYFNAYTAFGSSSPIVNIFSPNLVSDLSVIFHPTTSTADLSGTPRLVDVPGGTYTFRAVNANGLSTDISTNVPITLDTISMSSTMDASSTFILSRGVSNAKTGYYKSPLQFTAYAGSGNAITFSAAALSGTGLSLSNVTPNTVQIVGTPVRTSGLTSLAVTATAANTAAISTLTKQFSVINDVITINPFSLTAIQNVVLAPYQITASSLSERSVVSYSGLNIPQGLTISSTGLVSGSIGVSTSGTITVNGSTGYASGTLPVSYTVTPDNILLLAEEASYSIVPGTVVSANITGVAYSGGTVSNYRFSNLSNTFGMTIDSNTGTIGGTLFTGIPPQLLPASCNFFVAASAGALTATLPATLTTINPYLSNQYLVQTCLSNQTGNGLFASSQFSTGSPTVYSAVDSAIPSGSNYPTDLRIRPNTNGLSGRFLMPYINYSSNGYTGQQLTTPYIAYSDNGLTFGKTDPAAFANGCNFTYYDSGSNTQKTAIATLATVNALVSPSLSNWVTVGYVGTYGTGTQVTLSDLQAIKDNAASNQTLAYSAYTDANDAYSNAVTLGAPGYVLASLSANQASAYSAYQAAILAYNSAATAYSNAVNFGPPPPTPGPLVSGPALFRSSDDGATWTRTDFGNNETDLIFSRSGNGSNFDSNPSIYPTLCNEYLVGGFAMGYDSFNNRLLVGGGGAAGFNNYGYYNFANSTWYTSNSASISTPFAAEIACINTDVPRMFVATGTSEYSNITLPTMFSPSTYESNVSINANTIAYSTDSGASWSPGVWNSTDPSFNVIGGEVASDGLEHWLATGVRGSNIGFGSYQYSVGLAYSDDGSNWSTINLPLPIVPSTTRLFPPLPIGPIYYNAATSTWHVFATYTVTGETFTHVDEFIHDSTSTLASNWTSLSNKFDSNTSSYLGSNTRLVAARPTIYVKPPGDILTTLSFTNPGNGGVGYGPVLDVPSYTNVRIVQYVPMDPIVLSAHSQGGYAGPIYYYITKADLPIGLSFDPQTRAITGTPAFVGSSLVRIFLSDLNGTSRYSLGIEVIFPTVTTRPLSGAGAFTSYIRQYTLADAAQNSRNNKVLTESATLGEFMAPYGADNISSTIDPKCKNPSC